MSFLKALRQGKAPAELRSTLDTPSPSAIPTTIAERELIREFILEQLLCVRPRLPWSLLQGLIGVRLSGHEKPSLSGVSTMQESSQSSGKAITSLVLGVSSLLCSCVTGIPAIIFGFLALSDIKSSRSRLTGQNMAMTGIILGFAGSALSAFIMLIALLLPAVQIARQAARGADQVARSAQSRNNMKQIGLGLYSKVAETKEFPAQYTLDVAGKPGSSWRVQMLPYVGASGALGMYHFDEPWNSPGNQRAATAIPPQFVSPLVEGSPSGVSYVAVAGPGFVFDGDKPCKLDSITDGMSDTIALVEIAHSNIGLAEPRDLTWEEFLDRFQNQELGGALGGFNVLFADGSAQSVSYDIDPQTLRAFFTTNGREPVTRQALDPNAR